MSMKTIYLKLSRLSVKMNSGKGSKSESRQVGGVLWSDSLMNARIGIPTISGDRSCPTCLIKEKENESGDSSRRKTGSSRGEKDDN